ncbi:hypothetical protein OG871_39430 [Kitasatospora sp. NBC_00374]|uniref:hypothetical protein n=1 Tax=Kitasatospora sp. NBC_00374 TaxID=2975964 RepID=UPI00324E89E7
MSRKQQRTRGEKTPLTAVVPEQPAAPHQAPDAGEHLTGQIARGAASGAVRSVTDWIIQRVSEHFS